MSSFEEIVTSLLGDGVRLICNQNYRRDSIAIAVLVDGRYFTAFINVPSLVFNTLILQSSVDNISNRIVVGLDVKYGRAIVNGYIICHILTGRGLDIFQVDYFIRISRSHTVITDNNQIDII